MTNETLEDRIQRLHKNWMRDLCYFKMREKQEENIEEKQIWNSKVFTYYMILREMRFYLGSHIDFDSFKEEQDD